MATRKIKEKWRETRDQVEEEGSGWGREYMSPCASRKERWDLRDQETDRPARPHRRAALPQRQPPPRPEARAHTLHLTVHRLGSLDSRGEREPVRGTATSPRNAT